MTSQISPAIIMRVKEFGESDLLVSFFTPDKGRLKGVAKGARRSRRRFSNSLDLFCLTNLEYELKRGKDLHFLHSSRLLSGFAGIRSDFTSLSLASYMVELTEILFPPLVPDRRMFDLLKDSFIRLNQGQSSRIIRIVFEARAMALGGYAIHLEKCCNCRRPYTGEGRAVFIRSKGGISCLKCGQGSSLTRELSPAAVKAISIIQSGTLDTIEGLALTDEVIGEIRPVLALHIEYRIGRRLKSAEYLTAS